MALPEKTNEKTDRPLARRARDPFGLFHTRLDRLFEDFFGDFDRGGRMSDTTALAAITPSLDVSETEKAYKIAIELPGVEDKDLDVTVAEGVLTIKGEKRSESEEKDENFHRVERSYGSFERRLSLPAEADPDKIDADFKNGVLTVKVPKTKKAQDAVKKISIKSK